MDKVLKRILNYLPENVEKFFLENSARNITEIRIRQNCNIILISDGDTVVLQDTNISSYRLQCIFLELCDKTLSAYEDQIKDGYITLENGHRIGIGGRYTQDVTGKTVLGQVTSLNIRISSFHKINLPDEILNFEKGILICGKPHSGKTTLIRNICFALNGMNYTVCDERNEIFHSTLNGDFISGIPKDKAIMQAVRVLNPDIIICDEIGNKNETEKMLEYLNTGVKFICSIHCNNFCDLKYKPNISLLISAGVFDKYIFLENIKGNFYIKEVVDD